MKLPLALFALLFVHGCGDTSADPARPAGSPPPSAAPAHSGGSVRSVAGFHAIEVAGTIGVDVAIDRATHVEVTGEPDLLDRVTTDVKNGVLVIDTRDGNLPRNHLRVSVTMPDVSALTVSGTGALSVDGVANAKLEVSVPGTGAIHLAGTTGTLALTLDGTGSFDARKLSAKTAMIDMTGTGSVTLTATDAVDAKLSGTGSITVHGHPSSVKRVVTGTGRIKIAS